MPQSHKIHSLTRINEDSTAIGYFAESEETNVSAGRAYNAFTRLQLKSVKLIPMINLTNFETFTGPEQRKTD